MRYSKLFGKTVKTVPAEVEAVSNKLLLKGGFIDQLSAGIYSFLPLGWRVHKNIENIIRQEMDNIDGQEIFMPTLQPKSLWIESDRWEHIDPPLFKLKDQHDREYALGSTHEEVITDLVRQRVSSYKDLPLYLYQIQNKFRNEIRSTGGLLRVREFIMKDLYSFHTDEKDLMEYFQKVKEAYVKIYTRCGLEVAVCQAAGGTIGGKETFEFHILAPVGEDRIVYCPSCKWGANKEVFSETKCPKCQTDLEESSSIEAGHIFALGTKYSEALKAEFVDNDGNKKPIWMGCYGIGLGRLMAAIIEAHNDEKGIIWPKSVSPYQAQLIAISNEQLAIRERADEIYQKLSGAGVEVLYDDREDVSAGEKFADADLIGIPVRLVISERNRDKIEFKERDKKESKLLTVEEIVAILQTCETDISGVSN